jgi:DNA gyrase inhibitor GyrI
MKHILNKMMLLPALVLPFLFASCDEDNGDNPTLDVSQATGFVLNTPAYATNNTYDLASATSVSLTCSQPNYGGVPYMTRYYVQVAIDGAFLNDTTVAHKELTTSYTTAQMAADASELNDAVVKLFQEANPDTDFPNDVRPVYIRLRAIIEGTPYGQCYSNIITLPNVKATYVAPAATLPTELFVVGSSIQNAWSSWKSMAPVYGLAGQFYTMVYFPEGAAFKWGTFNNDWRGFDRIKTINDNAGAGLSAAADGGGNIVVSKGGWYVLNFVAEIVGKSIQYTLNVYPGKAYIIGNATPSWTDADPALEMTAPADASGQWVSPAFTAAAELRAYIKVPGIDWWRTEFTLYKGNLYWRTMDIPNDWATNVGSDYSVTCAPGKKLYVNFDYNTGEVK